MGQAKEVEITIKPDGTIDIEQIGEQGKECAGKVDDLIASLGKEIKTNKTADYYKQQKVRINQRHTG